LASLAAWAASKGYVVLLPEGAIPAWIVLALFGITVTGMFAIVYGERKPTTAEKRGWILLYLGTCGALVTMTFVVYRVDKPLQLLALALAALAAAMGGIRIIVSIFKSIKSS
jgi:hypothetical protein